MHQWLADEVARFVGQEPLGDLLDVATGTGLALRALAGRASVSTMTGIDPATRMLDVARHELPEARFVEGRAEKLPFGENTFDSVLCVSALPYLSAPLFFAEAARVVRPAGLIVITSYAEDGITVPRLLRQAARESGVTIQDPNASTGTTQRMKDLAAPEGLALIKEQTVRFDAPMPDPRAAVDTTIEYGFAPALAAAPRFVRETVRERFAELLSRETADVTTSLIVELRHQRET